MAKRKRFPEWASTVTPLSKTLALLMFIIFPILGFYYGKYYQKQLDMYQTQTIITPVPTSPQPSGGMVSCSTNADCPPDYFCAQPGPIVMGKPRHRICWKKGSAMPL
jgi:hypothetical protein